MKLPSGHIHITQSSSYRGPLKRPDLFNNGYEGQFGAISPPENRNPEKNSASKPRSILLETMISVVFSYDKRSRHPSNKTFFVSKQ